MTRPRSKNPRRAPAAPAKSVPGSTFNLPTFAVSEIGSAWSALPVSVRQGWNSLCVKMAASGLHAGKTRQTGYTLYTQMSRAARLVYRTSALRDAPAAIVPPPPIGDAQVTATLVDGTLRLFLSGASYAGGVQVMTSAAFVPGGPNPYNQRAAVIGVLPSGWGEGGIDLSAGFAKKHGTAGAGAAILVKLTPVGRDGFVGPSWCEIVVVE